MKRIYVSCRVLSGRIPENILNLFGNIIIKSIEENLKGNGWAKNFGTWHFSETYVLGKNWSLGWLEE